MQMVGVLLEALDHHICDRLDSVEKRIAGLAGNIEKGWAVDLRARKQTEAFWEQRIERLLAQPKSALPSLAPPANTPRGSLKDGRFNNTKADGLATHLLDPDPFAVPVAKSRMSPRSISRRSVSSQGNDSEFTPSAGGDAQTTAEDDDELNPNLVMPIVLAQADQAYDLPREDPNVVIMRHVEHMHAKLEYLNQQNKSVDDKLTKVHRSSVKADAKIRGVVVVDPETGKEEKCKEEKFVAPKSEENHRKEMANALHMAKGLAARHAHADWHEDNIWLGITGSSPFLMLSMGSIVINGLLVGIEADQMLKYLLGHQRFVEGTLKEDVPEFDDSFFRMTYWVVLAWWFIELLCYFLAQRLTFFNPKSPVFGWNMFDVVCTLFTAIDLVADLAGVSVPKIVSQGYLRLLRMCRWVRVLRVVKIVRFLQGVRKLIIAVQGALLTLAWALLLLALFMYIYAIMMSTAIVQYYQELEVHSYNTTAGDPFLDLHGQTRTEAVEIFYGGIVVIMQTLFESITGGDWTVAALPLADVSWPVKTLWFSYVAFVIFGLLNVFTGIFCESASHAANCDREIVMQAEREDEEGCVNQIKLLFQNSDEIVDGNITESILKALLLQQNFKDQLSALGLHSTEAHGLFKLLDGDSSGSVSIDEFISGCLRLKGVAQAVDMVTMLSRTDQMSRKLYRIEKILLGDAAEKDDFEEKKADD